MTNKNHHVGSLTQQLRRKRDPNIIIGRSSQMSVSPPVAHPERFTSDTSFGTRSYNDTAIHADSFRVGAVSYLNGLISRPITTISIMSFIGLDEDLKVTNHQESVAISPPFLVFPG